MTSTDQNTETAPQLVARYNSLVASALAYGLTGYRELRVFHDKPTALARIAQLEGTLAAHASGERAEAAREERYGGLPVEEINQHSLSSSPGRARLLADPRAEDIRRSVLADQQRATEQAAQPVAEEQTVAKAKKEKKIKEPKTNGNGAGRKAKYGDEQKITVLAETNPRRGPAGEAFGCYRTGSTVGTVIARMVEKCGISRGKALQHVAHDAEKGHVRVE